MSEQTADHITSTTDSHRVKMEARVAGLYEGLDEAAAMAFYRRGQKYARVMTAARAAAATGEADEGVAYLAAADELLAPLGETGARELRDFIAGVFREDENRVYYLVDNSDLAESSTSSFGVEISAATQAFFTMGRIVALMSHAQRRAGSPTLAKLLVEEVRDVAALSCSLPPHYNLAMLQGMGASWPELDAPTD